jgi:hypothetical protein
MSNKTHTINILFYCDDGDQSWVSIDANKKAAGFGPAFGGHDDSAFRSGEHEFGLGILKKLLEDYKYSGNFHNNVKIQVDVVNRNYDYDNKGYVNKALAKPNLNFITSELLLGYSQIWIFGMHYKNNHHPGDIRATTAVRAGLTKWEQHDLQELTANELQILADWMDAGNGVLITGDHSNDFSVSGQLNLGRALGKDIKRAGELRIWEGPPLAYGSTHVDTSHDYLGNADNPDMRLMLLQEDNIPQNIYFDNSPNFLRPRDPRASPPPHWLFQTIKSFYNSTGLVGHLPDHGHEGALKFPSNYNNVSNSKPVWPSKNGVQTKPEVVAWGTNYSLPKPNRFSFNARAVGLVSAYDGHAVGVGNIVAHSTWHHFINVNLVGFLNGKQPTNTLLHISDYFVNLAIFLDNPNRPKWWLDFDIWYELDLIPHPIPPDVKYGGESLDNKNPIPNRWTYTHEIGKQAINQLTKGINPLHFQHYIHDQTNMAAIEHGAGSISNYNISYTMVLGEMLNAASLQKAANKKLRNNDYVIKGIQQAFKNHVQMMESPLNPLKYAVDSISKKFEANVKKLN